MNFKDFLTYRYIIKDDLLFLHWDDKKEVPFGKFIILKDYKNDFVKKPILGFFIESGLNIKVEYGSEKVYYDDGCTRYRIISYENI